MSKCVVLREDEEDLADMVKELLEDAGYRVVHVKTVPDLLTEAERRSPCIALVDGTSPTSFDLWWLGPVLNRLGVPPVAFTAHASARQQYAADPNGFVGIITKPFDASEFVNLVDDVCWEGNAAAAS